MVDRLNTHIFFSLFHFKRFFSVIFLELIEYKIFRDSHRRESCIMQLYVQRNTLRNCEQLNRGLQLDISKTTCTTEDSMLRSSL